MTSWQDYIISGRISKTIEDTAWTFIAEVDEQHEIEFFTKDIRVHAYDHLGVDNLLFLGFVPNAQYVHKIGQNKISVTAVDYSWYLSRQTVPDNVILSFLSEQPRLTLVQIFGGSHPGTVTGFVFYTFHNVSNWSTIEKTFAWTAETNKEDAIKEICAHCGFVLHTFIHETADNAYPCAWFCDKDDIDTKLELPSAVTINNPDDYLIDIDVKKNQAEIYNQVIVIGYDQDTGQYFNGTVESAGVTAEEECPITFKYRDMNGLPTQAKVNAKATALYNELHTIPETYMARFEHRVDLRLYQKITFSGYSGISSAAQRITGISYIFNGLETIVEIQCSPISGLPISDSSLYPRTSEPNIITENESLIRNTIKKLPSVQIGEVVDISGNLAQVQMEDDTNDFVWVRIL